MPKLLQINVTANWGSTGKITEDIGSLVQTEGWESWIAYGRENNPSQSNLVKIGNKIDHSLHAVQTRLFDNHGLCSKFATKQFINNIRHIDPDIIHLHNIHGYYINYPILFSFLREYGKPIIWTQHDCWSFTGHCAYYSYIKCNKWKTGCNKCCQLHQYPSSFGLDNSKQNYNEKKNYFTNIPNLHIVSVSDWLKRQLSQSFLNNYPIKTIYNGIDTELFKPKLDINTFKKKTILGVASVWDERKGLNDFIHLRQKLPANYDIVLVGLSSKQISNLPKGIIGIQRTENVNHLIELYSSASVFVNASVEETLGMTTIEAMSCGTPCVVYDSTASPEIVEKDYCKVIPEKNIEALESAIESLSNLPRNTISFPLRNWVQSKFDKNTNYKQYLDLYYRCLKN